MTFNPDCSKQAQEIVFSRKFKKATHHPLLFNNNNISNAKLFADDTSLFSVVHNINTSAIELNNDLNKIND